MESGERRVESGEWRVESMYLWLRIELPPGRGRVGRAGTGSPGARQDASLGNTKLGDLKKK